MDTSITSGARPHEAQRHIDTNLPPLFRGVSFDSFEPRTPEQSQIAEAVRTWRGEPKLLLLGGTAGTGKTHLACARFIRVVDAGGVDGLLPQFWTEAELLRQWRLCHAENRREPQHESPDEFIHSLGVYPSLLVLDDIGGARLTDTAWAAMFDLIDLRYSHQHPTLVTTNYRISELTDTLGEKFSSRLASGLRLWMTGPNVRLPAKS